MDLVVRPVIMRDSFDCVPNCSVSPFGHSTTLRIFIDPDLLQYDEVWAAAGTWNDNFAITSNELVRVSGGVVTDLKRNREPD
jgi:prolyl-tRNA editing enzyme YbaK/EbsC (Cys-tRNA(Pro) deacylase)